MTNNEFIEKMEAFLDKTGMSDGCYGNSFMSVGEDKDINTSIYVDSDGQIWLSGQESVKRIKTCINVSSVKEFRYSQFDEEGGRFFVICDDYTGLDFCEGEVGFFQNGDFSIFKDAIDWFESESER